MDQHGKIKRSKGQLWAPEVPIGKGQPNWLLDPPLSPPRTSFVGAPSWVGADVTPEESRAKRLPTKKKATSRKIAKTKCTRELHWRFQRKPPKSAGQACDVKKNRLWSKQRQGTSAHHLSHDQNLVLKWSTPLRKREKAPISGCGGSRSAVRNDPSCWE